MKWSITSEDMLFVVYTYKYSPEDLASKRHKRVANLTIVHA